LQNSIDQQAEQKQNLINKSTTAFQQLNELYVSLLGRKRKLSCLEDKIETKKLRTTKTSNVTEVGNNDNDTLDLENVHGDNNADGPINGIRSANNCKHIRFNYST